MLLLGIGIFFSLTVMLPVQAGSDHLYHDPWPPRPGSIGKVYMNRPIARVMGYEGAYWLERPQRAQEENPDAVIAALNLQPTDIVADIGSGTGYFSTKISEQVLDGTVLAVDVQPQMQRILASRLQDEGIDNIIPILGEEQDPHLPAGEVDLALMVDTYHEFAYPYEMMQGILKGLKPGGRVVLVEYKKENPLIPIKPLHKMSQAQVRREMAGVGLEWMAALEVVPHQHVLVFQKPADSVTLQK
ncbi:MAG: class I SAM-dependent methyltransferase [Synechococcaceae cyanobacterium SM2_3_1]|nr:class I SAM-dependent methyltransferase [Synechococcaceae cyanobacterium SM2_3_1]